MLRYSKDISKNTEGDNDLRSALHGFTLSTFCTVWVSDIPQRTEKSVVFHLFYVIAKDRYDFNGKKFVPAPNLDFKNPTQVARPVAPEKESIIIFEITT
jgi:hypothetical protein